MMRQNGIGLWAPGAQGLGTARRFAAYRSRWGCGALMLGLALVALGCGPGDSGSERRVETNQRPNILWVIWDTVRADRLSPYNPALRTTPRLEAWAKGARVFEDTVSPASTTESSHASMFTGQLPSQHGTDASNRWLADEWDTVAERLRRAGYRTFLWSANPHVSAGENFDQGFDRVAHPWDPMYRDQALKIVTRKVSGDRSSELSDRLQRARVGPWAIKAAGELAAISLENWLDTGDRDRPWFAVLNYMEAHRPLIPPRAYRERVMSPEQVEGSYRIDRSWLPLWKYNTGLHDYSEEELAVIRGTYDASLAELDDLFAELLASLESQGRLENTIVILTSDHGEHLGEHHLLDHQYSLYRPLTHVPLIIAAPGRWAPGRDTRPVTTLDLYPTVLEWAGAQEPGGGSSRARSLLREGSDRARISEYSAPNLEPLAAVARSEPGFDPAPWSRSLRSLRVGSEKLIWASDGRHEFYDLDRDPGEESDLSARDPERFAQRLRDLKAEMALSGSGVRMQGVVQPPSAQQRAMLEGLGYLDAEGESDSGLVPEAGRGGDQ